MWSLAGGALGGFLLGSQSGGGGGNSSSTPSSQSVTTSNIAPWAQQGVQSLIQSGMANAYPEYSKALDAYNQQMAQYQANGSVGPAPVAPTNLGNQAGYTPFNAGATDPMTQQALQAAQSTTAGFTPLQQQSFNTASNLQTPGQYGQASDITNLAAQGLQNSAGAAGMYGQYGANYGTSAAAMAPQAQQYGQTGAMMGARSAGQANQLGGNVAGQAMGTSQQALGYGNLGTQQGLSYGQNAQDPNAIANYMNPYLQNVLNPQEQALEQMQGQQAAQQNAQATQSGAFGGSRQGLQQVAQNAANQQQMNSLIGTGYNNAFNSANQNMQTAATLGMQGAQTGLQGVQGAQSGLNTALGGGNLQIAGTQQGIAGQQLGLSGLGQANNLYNTGIQGAQTGITGVNSAQNAYTGMGNQGQNLANIGTQQLNAQQNIAGLQNAYGAQQQQQNQNMLNQGMANYATMQQYPMQQLGQLESLYTGAPQNITTQNYTAAPSMISQAAGLATAGAGAAGVYNKLTGTPGANNAKGGRIKAPDNRKKSGAGLGDLALAKLA